MERLGTIIIKIAERDHNYCSKSLNILEPHVRMYLIAEQ